MITEMKLRDANVKSPVRFFLKNHGLESADQVNEWFIKGRADGYRIDGFDQIRQILIDNKEKVFALCGDYDADGVCAEEIGQNGLGLFLKTQGVASPRIVCRTPKRHTEGYGLNTAMVQALYQEFGSDVVLITVDNGIVCFEQIALAKSYGWPVIVLDHHQGKLDTDGKPILPAADVVVDPSFLPGTADFSDYCGAGLMYKLVVYLNGRDAVHHLMPLAALATIADICNLSEDNYVIVRDGLARLNKRIAPKGLLTLVEANEIDHVTETSVGFTLAPEINAWGRMLPDGAEKAVQMLGNDADTDYLTLAKETIGNNETRKSQTEAGLQQLMQRYADDNYESVYVRNMNVGLTGVLVPKVMDLCHKVVSVITETPGHPDQVTGSIRGLGSADVKAALDEVAAQFRKDGLCFGDPVPGVDSEDAPVIGHYGGHPHAAGVSFAKKNAKAFEQYFAQALAAQNPDFSDPEENLYDLSVEAHDLEKAAKAVAQIAPCGEGNPAPVFQVTNFQPLPYNGEFKRLIGKDKKTVRFQSVFGTAIGFGMADQLKDICGNKPLTLYGKISFNYFRGNATPQIEFFHVEEQ